MSESVAQAVRSESCRFEPGSSCDPFDKLTCTMDGERVVAALTVRAAAKEERLGWNF